MGNGVWDESDIPRAEPMLKAERAKVENCILTVQKSRPLITNVLLKINRDASSARVVLADN
jgi:hypothetical protein